MNTSAFEKAIDLVGSQSEMARRLGKKQGHVWKWRRDGVPAEYVIRVETATNGAVSRHELRPDIYPLENIKGVT